MDRDPEKIHDLLLEVQLPSTLADLKNPSEEYVVDLLTKFLTKFGIDLSGIRNPTPEQLSDGSLAHDYPELISLINLSEAMAGICNQLFLKDFNLTDLTSPTPKKTRTLAKVLSNFLLYSVNKNSIIEERLEEIRHKIQHLDDINKNINIYKELKNQKAVENAKKIALKEQLEAEIPKIKAAKDGRKLKIAEVKKRLQDVEKEKNEIVQRHGNLKAEALKMQKITEDLELKLVRSPEHYETRLKDLVEQKKNLTEKRELMEEAMMSKKPAIERIQSHLSVVSNAHAKFPEIIEAYKNLTESKQKLGETIEKLSEMNSLIKQEALMTTQESSQASDELLQKTKDECEEKLSVTRNHLAELLNEKKRLERKLVDDRTRQQEIYLERDEIRVKIEQVERETEEFVTECQEIYDKEINKERRLKNSLERKLT